MFLGPRSGPLTRMLEPAGDGEARRVDAAGPVGAHPEVGAAEGLVPLRRSAPDGGDRPCGAAEGEGRHPRRAHRRARRGADRAGAGPGPPPGRLPGVGVLIISHNLADVFRGVPTTSTCSTSAPWSRSWTRRNTTYDDVVGYITGIKINTDPADIEEEASDDQPVEKSSNPSVNTAAETVAAANAALPRTRSPPATRARSATSSSNYFRRVRAGEMGMLPALAGLLVLSIAVLGLNAVLPHQKQHREPDDPDRGADDARDRADLRDHPGRDRPVRRHHRRRRDGDLHPADSTTSDWNWIVALRRRPARRRR